MIVTTLDPKYMRWAKCFLKSLSITNPHERVHLETVNLSPEQIQQLKNIHGRNITFNNHTLPEELVTPNYMTTQRVNFWLDVMKKFPDDIFVFTDVDLLVRKGLFHLYNKLNAADAALIFRDGMGDDGTGMKYYEKLRVAAGIVLVKRSGMPLIEEWVRLMATEQKIDTINKNEWYWDQIALWRASQSSNVTCATIEEELYINRNFNDTYIWSANRPDKDGTCARYRQEVLNMLLWTNVLPTNQRNTHGNQSELKDRFWLERMYLPSLKGKILSVGVQNYTDFYHSLVKRGSKFITVDCDPEVAIFGSPSGHYIDTATSFLSFTEEQFDHISLHGLFGQTHSPIKDPHEIIELINLCCDKLVQGGTIQFGSSTDTISVDALSKILSQTKMRDWETLEHFVCRPSQLHSEMIIEWKKKTTETEMPANAKKTDAINDNKFALHAIKLLSGAKKLHKTLPTYARRAKNKMGRLYRALLVRIKIMTNKRGFDGIYSQSAPYTLTSLARMKRLYEAVVSINVNSIEGDFVECGVFKGGSVMNMILTQLNYTARPMIHLYDTFEGMTPATELDINHLGVHVNDMIKENPDCLCICTIEQVKKNINRTKYPTDKLQFHKGDVAITLKDNLPKRIALLRLDTDWYESTKIELEALYPRLVTGGILIIDDYGFYLGARKAVDDYFASIGVNPEFELIDHTGVLHIKKR